MKYSKISYLLVVNLIYISIILGLGIVIVCNSLYLSKFRHISILTFPSGKYGYCMGDYVVCTDSGSGIHLGPSISVSCGYPYDRPNAYPIVLIWPNNKTNTSHETIGHVNVVDSQGCGVDIEYEEMGRTFKNLTLHTVISSNEISYRDQNLQGQFNVRLGPGNKKAFLINGKWHDIQLDTNVENAVGVQGN